MENSGARGDVVVSARRRLGKLYAVTTEGGRRFLVLRDPSTERFLEQGAILGADDLAQLAGPVARAAGLALAYRMLAGRDRTERELRDALARDGVTTPETAADIVDTLRRQGYLDDRRLASHYVRYAAAHRPAGPRLLRRKLRAAGVADETIDAELAEALPPEREKELALAVARRGMRGAKSREQAARRVHGLLARRGFSERIARSICAAILRGTVPGEDE